MANLWRVRTVWSGVTGSPYYTNTYYTSDGLNLGAQYAQDSWFDFLHSLQGSISAGVIYTVDGQVQEIDDATGTLLGVQSVPTQFEAGSAVGELIPRASQALIQWRTSAVVAGRFLKGRSFLPGMVEALNSALGAPTSATVSAFTAAAQAHITNPNSQLVIWSRAHGTSAPATSGACWSEWAQLRSRRD